MKKFFNAALEKAKAIWAYLKGLVRKPESEAVEETAEAEPSVVEKVATVVGMCALVGVIGFCVYCIGMCLITNLECAYVWVHPIAEWLGIVARGTTHEVINAVTAHDTAAFCRYLGECFSMAIMAGVYIGRIAARVTDDAYKPFECAQSFPNYVVNYCKNHPYKVLLFVLASIHCCMPVVWHVYTNILYDVFGIIRASYGDIASAAFGLCAHTADAALLIAALVCVRM